MARSSVWPFRPSYSLKSRVAAITPLRFSPSTREVLPPPSDLLTRGTLRSAFRHGSEEFSCPSSNSAQWPLPLASCFASRTFLHKSQHHLRRRKHPSR